MSLKRPRLKSALPSAATLSPLRRQRDRPVSDGDEDRVEDGDQPTASEDTETVSRISDTAERTRTSKRRIQRRVIPLDVLQQPLQAGMRKVFDLRRFLIVLGLTGAVLLIPQPEGSTECTIQVLYR